MNGRALAVGIALVGVAFALVPSPTRGTQALMTGSTTNVTNQVSNKSLVSPTGLTATSVPGTNVSLSWTAPSPNDGNGYAISAVNNGASSSCPATAASYTTWIAGSASTSYTDSSAMATGAPGTFACYLVQTGYRPAGGPPWASAPQWTSQGSLGTAPVALGIANKQAGAEAFGLTTVSPTIAASTAGTLLVATVASADATTAFSGPAGWTRAARATLAGDGAVEIWYQANNPGGVTTATFSDAAAFGMAAEMSEFSGVATASPLDASGTLTASTAATTFTVSTSAAATVNGELTVTGFRAGGGACTYTSPGGWTHLVNDAVDAFIGDYALGTAATTQSELMTCNASRTWTGVIATFK